ncbi:DUF3450 domain-containing protein [Parvularcula sp. ZS-1/3]|uniref:DUF3450 domain-containing protein n=1 Tax=Parvularcula mediterranea TaxID=2732508 RepID=A0A7Y3RJG8_9PROT|nr:DUF3450 domain-containing protein [Parvularcula mediterranea]NNU15212.1 DUF3450 domain-containing protein [Parvularcula mediterranea]
MHKKIALLGTAMVAGLSVSVPASAQFSQALDISRQTARDGAASQQRVEQLDDQAKELLNDYRAATKQLDLLRRFNDSQRAEIENQVEQIAGLRTDIANVEGLEQAVVPLIGDMLEQLKRIVAADIPFLTAERQARLDRLDSVMADPTQTAASRYRLIIEAYQIENEYGRTIQAYNGTVVDGDQELTVEFLRIGRIALIYKTADDSGLRIYNQATGAWDDLDRSFLDDVRMGLRMAKEQLPPGLLQVPVKAPQAAIEAVSTAPAE